VGKKVLGTLRAAMALAGFVIAFIPRESKLAFDLFVFSYCFWVKVLHLSYMVCGNYWSVNLIVAADAVVSSAR